MSLSVCFVLFIIYSFLGWFVETIHCARLEKKFTNRGFMIGPICPIYGIGSILIILFLSPFSNYPIVVFVLAILLCSILEYFTSYIMEKVFKARWWDYSEEKFNINGRICLEIILGFGVLAIVVLYIINPFVFSFISKISPYTLCIIAIVLAGIFIIDFVISSKIIFKFESTVKNYKKDSTREITTYVRDELANKSVFCRRFMNAFPNLKARVVKVINGVIN